VPIVFRDADLEKLLPSSRRADLPPSAKASSGLQTRVGGWWSSVHDPQAMMQMDCQAGC